MVKHSASTLVGAPAAQVYELFTHFADFPKFMSHVKAVTSTGEGRTHWVADILGEREWEAVNENWIPGRQIGWRSIGGLVHCGTVQFTPEGDQRTCLHVEIEYEPPAGPLGSVGEALGGGAEFERRLQQELDHFAQMVHAAPPGALDPNSSSYLFHDYSAAMSDGADQTTTLQDTAIGGKA